MHREGESSAKTKRVHGCKYALQTQRGGLGHQNIKGTNQGVRNKICKEHRASESSKNRCGKQCIVRQSSANS